MKNRMCERALTELATGLPGIPSLQFLLLSSFKSQKQDCFTALKESTFAEIAINDLLIQGCVNEVSEELLFSVQK